MLGTTKALYASLFRIWGRDRGPNEADEKYRQQVIEDVSIYEFVQLLFYDIEDGPRIGVTTVGVLESSDGLFFKDRITIKY